MKTYKFIFIFLILFVGFNGLTAQEKQPFELWEESYYKGIDLYNQNNFIDAIPYLEKAKTYIDQIDFNTDAETQYFPVYHYDHLGACYYRTSQFEKAAENYLAALNRLQTIENPDFDYAKRMLNAVVFSYEKYDPEKALQLLNEVLSKVKSAGNSNNTDYAELLFTRFQIYKYLNDTLGVLESLKEAYDIHEALGTQDHQHYSYIVFNLAYTYYHQEDYGNALTYFRKTDVLLDIYKSQNYISIDKLNYDYALCLFKQNLFDEAEEKFRTLINDTWFLAPENAEFNLYANNYLGLSLYYQDKTKEAKQVYENGIAHLAGILDAYSPLLALQKTNLTRLLIYTDDYDHALSISEEVYNTMENAGHTQSQAYINAVNNLGLLYMYKSDFNSSKTYLENALSISTNSFSPNLLHIADIKSNLAYVYQKLGQYQNAKTFHEDVLETKTLYLHPTSPDYAKALVNYGTYLSETGEHLKAEDYFKKAEDIFKNNNDNSSLLYANLKYNLAQLYYMTRRLKLSLNHYQQAISIYQDKSSESPENLAGVLNGKAKCLLALGDTKSALEIATQAFSLIKDNFGNETIQYGDALLSFGKIKYSIGAYDDAYSYFNQAYKIFEKHLDYGSLRFIDIARYYLDQFVVDRDYDAALSIVEKIEENLIQTYGFESYDYAQILYQKARITTDMGNYDYATRLYESVSSVFANTVSKSSDTYTNMLYNYAATLDKANKTDEAIDKYKKYFNGIQNQLKDVFTYRSEADKKKFLNQLQYNTFELNGTIFQNNTEYKALIGSALNNQLMLKSLLLNASKEILTNLSQLTDSTIAEKVDRYSNIKFQLSDPLVLNDQQRTSELRQEFNSIETELVTLHDKKFGNTLNQNFNRDWTKIKTGLNPNEVAIEFVEFEISNDKNLDKKRAYGAYVITYNSETPKAISLFMAEDINAILKHQNPNTLYQTRGSRAKSTTNTKGLYELIWAPLESEVNGMETVYFSPTGVLNQIPFAALDTEDKPILASQYNLIQLSSTYGLAEQTAEPKTDQTLFIGGIDYDYKSNITKTNTESSSVSELESLKSLSGTRSMDTQWTYLPGTLEEVNAIERLFSNSKKTYTTLVANNASESSFKNISGDSPSVIHIATHGFFFENPKTTPIQIF